MTGSALKFVFMRLLSIEYDIARKLSIEETVRKRVAIKPRKVRCCTMCFKPYVIFSPSFIPGIYMALIQGGYSEAQLYVGLYVPITVQASGPLKFRSVPEC